MAFQTLARAGGRREDLLMGTDQVVAVFGAYGHTGRFVVAELRAGLPPTLAVAGGYLDGIGVPACVASGTRAAAALAVATATR